jgi:type 1 fimbriae regulatory protein FimB/type 1 fimbriae regulatory protein FimE
MAHRNPLISDESRLKRPSTHPLRGPELRALRLRKDSPTSPYLFVTERGGPMTTSAVRKLMAKLGTAAKIDSLI